MIKLYLFLRFMAGLCLLVLGLFVGDGYIIPVYHELGAADASVLIALVVAMFVGAYECLTKRVA